MPLKEKKQKKGFADSYKRYDTTNGFGNGREWREGFSQKMGQDEAHEILNDYPNTSPFQILGLSFTATQEEIKKAFKILIMKWHPDRNNAPEAEAMSKKIIAAYTILIHK